MPIPPTLLVGLVSHPLINETLVHALRCTIAYEAVTEDVPSLNWLPSRPNEDRIQKIRRFKRLDRRLLMVCFLQPQTPVIFWKRELAGRLVGQPVIEDFSEAI